jgi:hypothetical protein
MVYSVMRLCINCKCYLSKLLVYELKGMYIYVYIYTHTYIYSIQSVRCLCFNCKYHHSSTQNKAQVMCTVSSYEFASEQATHMAYDSNQHIASNIVFLISI